MTVDPRNFFETYVLSPYDAWINDELCEWKALAVASGLNALVEHVFRQSRPPNETIGTRDYQKGLGAFRNGLSSKTDHEHIRYVVEAYKHVERRDPTGSPSRLDDMTTRTAGSFSSAFSPDFDVVRDQLGFPFQGNPPTWVPLRRVVEHCIAYWKGHFGL